MSADALPLRGEQGRRILQLYHLYRLVISSALVLLVFSDMDAELLQLASGDLPDASDITPAHHATLGTQGSTGPLDAALMELEVRMLRDTLAAVAGNQSEAARRLGVSRVGLIKKMTRLGLR